MGAWRGASQYPSIGEFGGYFNIPDQYDNIGPVLRSNDVLPEFGFPELWEVYSAALKWFANALPLPQPQPVYVPAHEEIFVPICESDDRTLLIDHIDYGRLSVPLLRRMQTEFLGRFPLWRLHLNGWDSESGIVVYPTAVRFGDQLVDVDPEEALRKLVAHGKLLREAWLRPQRAQIAFLREQLPGAVRRLAERSHLVFAVLDNYEGDHSRLAICLLMRGADGDAVTVERPRGAGLEFFSVAGAYYLDVAGTLVPDSPTEPPFCVRLWLPPAEYRGPLTLIEASTGQRDTYEVMSERITHLPAMG